MRRIYIVDGKKYTFEEVSYVPGKEQVFKINGQKVKLSVTGGNDEERFMELKMPELSRDKANEVLPAVYTVMDARIKRDEAHKLEQAAMLKLHYNEALRAEDVARGLSGGNTVVQSVVNKDDLSIGKEQVKLDMDLTKRFSWLNNVNSREYKALMQIEQYRKIEYYPDGSIHDTLAQQRRDFDRRMEELASNNTNTGRGNNASLFVRMMTAERS